MQEMQTSNKKRNDRSTYAVNVHDKVKINFLQGCNKTGWEGGRGELGYKLRNTNGKVFAYSPVA